MILDEGEVRGRIMDDHRRWPMLDAMPCLRNAGLHVKTAPRVMTRTSMIGLMIFLLLGGVPAV